MIFFQATGLPLRHLRRGPHAEEHGHCQIREPDARSGTSAMISHQINDARRSLPIMWYLLDAFLMSSVELV